MEEKLFPFISRIIDFLLSSALIIESRPKIAIKKAIIKVWYMSKAVMDSEIRNKEERGF